MRADSEELRNDELLEFSRTNSGGGSFEQGGLFVIADENACGPLGFGLTNEVKSSSIILLPTF